MYKWAELISGVALKYEYCIFAYFRNLDYALINYHCHIFPTRLAVRNSLPMTNVVFGNSEHTRAVVKDLLSINWQISMENTWYHTSRWHKSNSTNHRLHNKEFKFKYIWQNPLFSPTDTVG